MRRLIVIAGLVLATLAGGGGGSPRPAHAAPPPPPTLTDEDFSSSSFANNNTVNCHTLGLTSSFGTATFGATGTASGPYEGAFTETGSVSNIDNDVTDFSARFVIESELGTVVGTLFAVGSTGPGGHDEDGLRRQVSGCFGVSG